MTAFPESSSIVLPLHISTLSRYGCGYEARAFNVSNPASSTWVANIIAYMPVTLPFPYPVRRVWWGNGATVSNNADFGIYTMGGTKIYSTGSTVTAGASSVQYVAVSPDLLLQPGMYYFAWTTSGTTTAALAEGTPAIAGRLSGMLQQTAAIPLPATMTPVTVSTLILLPYCGVTRTSTGF